MIDLSFVRGDVKGWVGGGRGEMTPQRAAIEIAGRNKVLLARRGTTNLPLTHPCVTTITLIRRAESTVECFLGPSVLRLMTRYPTILVFIDADSSSKTCLPRIMGKRFPRVDLTLFKDIREFLET